MQAQLIHDGDLVALSDGNWGEVFPVEKLAGQVLLYRRLRDRDGGRYAQFYAGTVASLEAVARQAGVRLPAVPAQQPAGRGRR